MKSCGGLTMRVFQYLAVFIVVLLDSRHAFAVDEYRCDFREWRFDNIVLAPISPGTVKLMHQQKDGLMMSIPAGQMLPSVAIRPGFAMKGDFEISASFTISKLQFPIEGYGTGPTIYLATHSSNSTSALIGRLMRTDRTNVFSTNVASNIDGKRKQQVELFPAESQSGSLKVIRAGAMLKFLAADGIEGSFRELRDAEFTTDDIALVRLGVQQSDASTPVEIYWHDIIVQADELVGQTLDLNSETKRFNPTYKKAPEPERLSWWWSVGAGTSLIVLTIAIFRFRNNKSSRTLSTQY